MKKRFSAAFVVLAMSSAGCTQSATQKLSDTSYDVAMAERFGRLDIVTDQVAPANRDAFIEAHADWGGDIRIVDLEYAGMRLSDERHADVMLTVAWQRFDEFSLRTTKLLQVWEHTKDRWYITEEKEVSGDRGLLDEADAMIDPKGGAKPKATRGPRDDASTPRRGGSRSFDDPAPLSVD
ncbi:MAG: hypothetical protein U0414_07530 [Polyangiaceae bacterium]